MLRVLVNKGDKITHVLVYDDDDVNNDVNNMITNTTIKGCMIYPNEKMGYHNIWFRSYFRELREGEEFQIAFTEDILSSGKLYIKGDYRNRKDCVIDFNENKITVRDLIDDEIIIDYKTPINIKTLVIKKKFDV